MIKVGLLVRLRAKPGKEAEVAQFLEGALPAAQGENQTVGAAVDAAQGRYFLASAAFSAGTKSNLAVLSE